MKIIIRYLAKKKKMLVFHWCRRKLNEKIYWSFVWYVKSWSCLNLDSSVLVCCLDKNTRVLYPVYCQVASFKKSRAMWQLTESILLICPIALCIYYYVYGNRFQGSKTKLLLLHCPKFTHFCSPAHLELVNKMWLVGLVEHEKEVMVGQMRLGQGAAGSCWPPPSFACDLHCGVGSSHSQGHFNQHPLRAETYAVKKGRSERKQEAEAGALKRVWWTRPGIDGGHEEGPACSFQGGQRTREEKKTMK